MVNIPLERMYLMAKHGSKSGRTGKPGNQAGVKRPVKIAMPKPGLLRRKQGK